MRHKSIKLSHASKTIGGMVQLTGSKSESNRALIIQAISKGRVAIENLSEADDTLLINRALQLASEPSQQQQTIDIGPAGTAMRFMTSYLSLIPSEFILTGSQRMQQRPIGVLVDALRSLGADISYQKNEGYPPLHIKGGAIDSKNTVNIPGNISSQYISSLLLIASELKNGLRLQITGELTSRPYVTMTLNMLAEAGIAHNWQDNLIEILPQQHKPTTLYIEPDWSAASYWYAMVALSEKATILLPGLKKNSLQGDIAIADIMSHFGVKTTFQEKGILLEKTAINTTKELFDLKECPDLAQTVIVVAAALKINVAFCGLETLKIKETDRIAALQKEIGKFGAQLTQQTGTEIYHVQTDQVDLNQPICIETYEDHRMAMAFAPLALVMNQVEILEPQVVEKSYPMFWDHLTEQGFQITE